MENENVHGESYNSRVFKRSRRLRMTQRFANEYGTCQITALPGCPQVAVSHSVFVLPQFRRQGKGDENHKKRLQRMKDLHYDYVLCTVNHTNESEGRNLRDNGWVKISCFTSSNTEHVVDIYGRHLKNIPCNT